MNNDRKNNLVSPSDTKNQEQSGICNDWNILRNIGPLVMAPIVTMILFALPLVIASLIAESPYNNRAVFNDIEIGELWSDKASYVDEWYAVEAIDETTYIIGEPRSFQYNSSFLIIGNDKAILLDAGTGERPKTIPTMREMAQSLTDKPVMLMLSHFHVDHIGDLDAFKGVVMIDLPYLRTRMKAQKKQTGAISTISVSVLETVVGEREITILDWIKPNESIDLGGRKIEVLNTPGHTFESITLVDHDAGYAFTGDFMYQHLGGFVVFLPGSNLSVYVESIEELLVKTEESYRFFGAHGLQEYDTRWIKRVHREMEKVRDNTVDLNLSETFMIPGLPLRLHQKEQILIYLPPYIDSHHLFSWYFWAMAGVGYIILTARIYFSFQHLRKIKNRT